MSQKNILIIEDDDAIRELYIRQLGKEGFLVDGAADGKKGIVAVREKKYDLVLLDIMLPGIHGLEVLRQIKRGRTTKDIPVILLTNLGQDEVIKEGFKLGASAYLIKAAYSPRQVVEEVKSHLAGKNSSSG